MSKSNVLLLAAVGATLLGCAAGEEKLDPQFQKAFEAQGKRGPGAENPSMRGQSLPPGATPPPTK